MIRSKEEVTYFVDAQTGKSLSDIIYFDAPIFNRNETNSTVTYGVTVFKFVPKEEVTFQMVERSIIVETEDGIFIQLMDIPATYSIETFNKIMEGITFDNYEANKNRLMIEQIGRNSNMFFGLTSDKLTEV